MKFCPKCNISKQEDCFSLNKARHDGLDSYCKECNKARQKLHYNENKPRILSRQKNYKESSAYSLWFQSWLDNGGQDWKNNYQKTKRKKDIKFRLAQNMRSRISKSIKTGSAIQDLGCSIDELKLHLEKLFNSEMNWNNYGSYWEVDHIVPLASFDLTDREQFLKSCYYTNLQPLTCSDNRKKGAR